MKRVILHFNIAAVSAAMLTTVSPAQASTSAAGTISNVLVEQGKVFFHQSGSRTATPACATVYNRWVFDASTPAGQAMMSALLTFEARGVQIVVTGTAACADWGDTESVSNFYELP